MTELSLELREFIVSRFSSMEQIEVFVLLCRSPARRWTPEEVAEELRMAPESAGMRLFLLGSVGLLATEGSLDVRYWYAGAPALDSLAEAISEAHANNRPALAAIVERGETGTSARHFAEAFRLRKP